MELQRFIKILIHPFFIGLIITGIISLTFMPEIHKYKVEVIDRKKNDEKHSVIYSDLDNDQVAEKITLYDTPQVLNIILHKEKALIEQYNLRSSPLYNEHIHIEDFNYDGCKELFLLTQRNDSLLLSVIDPMVTRDFLVKERLLFYSDTLSFGSEYPTSHFVGLAKYGNSSEKDAVFAVQAGFKKQPRRFFRYSIKSDRLKISPLSGVSFRNPQIVDLNADSIPEILLTTRATGNHESSFPYSDSSSWLMVLDQNLEFVFEPVEFPGYPSSLVVSPYRYKDSSYIVALHHYHGIDSIPSSLMLFDTLGNKLLSRPIEQIDMNGYYLSETRFKGLPVIALLDATNGKVSLLDKNLEELSAFSIPELKPGGMVRELDMDFDGMKEKIFLGKDLGSLVVLRKNYRHPVVIDLGENEYSHFLSSYLVDGVPCIHAQFKNIAYVLKYKKDPLYYLKYPLLVALYVAISLIILLIFRLQKYRAEREYQVKRKMRELQILTLKNQVEPHFTFNILNSIGSLYTRGSDPDLAYSIFVRYSNLLRSTIKNSDKISIPLEEELDFVNSYVELEQFRSGYAFKYRVEIEEGLDLSTSIPRMLIHTFVENSIKHGVGLAEKEPLLELEVSRHNNSLQFLIRDNGPGLNSAGENMTPGTGKGLQILDEMIDLFQQLEGVRITYTLKVVSHDNSKQTRTEAVIVVPG